MSEWETCGSCYWFRHCARQIESLASGDSCHREPACWRPAKLRHTWRKTARVDVLQDAIRAALARKDCTIGELLALPCKPSRSGLGRTLRALEGAGLARREKIVRPHHKGKDGPDLRREPKVIWKKV